jgi:hypothetical protein
MEETRQYIYTSTEINDFLNICFQNSLAGTPTDYKFRDAGENALNSANAPAIPPLPVPNLGYLSRPANSVPYQPF